MDLQRRLFCCPQKEFLEPVLLGLAREQIAQHQEVDMLQVRFVVEPSVAREVSGKGIVHTSYDMWRRKYNRRKQRKYVKVAELVKIGPNATLRISFPDSVKEVRLEGDNVFHQGGQGVVLDLLLHCSYSPRLWRKQTPDGDLVLPHQQGDLIKRSNHDREIGWSTVASAESEDT